MLTPGQVIPARGDGGRLLPGALLRDPPPGHGLPPGLRHGRVRLLDNSQVGSQGEFYSGILCRVYIMFNVEVSM